MTEEEIREALDDCPAVRVTARRAAQWIDVHAARTCPSSAYIPRAGDERYVR